MENDGTEDWSLPPKKEPPLPPPPIGAVDRLAAALALAQGMFTEPVENKKVDFSDKNGRRIKYDYADLSSVMRAIRPGLSKNGLALVHLINRSGINEVLQTILMHESGQSLSSFYPVGNALLEDPKVFGGKLSYARRYTVSALTGVSSESGNDLNEYTGPQERAAAPKPVAPAAKPAVKNEVPATQAQLKMITAAATDKGVGKDELSFYMQNCYPGLTPSTLKRWQAEDILTFFEAPDTNAATVMAAADRARTEREVKQA